MTIDVTTVLKTVRGDDLMTTNNPDKKPATLRWVLVEACLAQFPDEQLQGEEKYKRWVLASKIQVEDKADLSIDELALLKKLVAKAYGPATVGPTYTLLEQKN